MAADGAGRDFGAALDRAGLREINFEGKKEGPAGTATARPHATDHNSSSQVQKVPQPGGAS